MVGAWQVERAAIAVAAQPTSQIAPREKLKFGGGVGSGHFKLSGVGAAPPSFRHCTHSWRPANPGQLSRHMTTTAHKQHVSTGHTLRPLSVLPRAVLLEL